MAGGDRLGIRFSRISQRAFRNCQPILKLLRFCAAKIDTNLDGGPRLCLQPCTSYSTFRDGSSTERPGRLSDRQSDDLLKQAAEFQWDPLGLGSVKEFRKESIYEPGDAAGRNGRSIGRLLLGRSPRLHRRKASHSDHRPRLDFGGSRGTGDAALPLACRAPRAAVQVFRFKPCQWSSR